MKGLKTEKGTFREGCKKDKLGKTHSKVIELLRMEMRKKENEKSKSRSRRI